MAETMHDDRRSTSISTDSRIVFLDTATDIGGKEGHGVVSEQISHDVSIHEGELVFRQAPRRRIGFQLIVDDIGRSFSWREFSLMES